MFTDLSIRQSAETIPFVLGAVHVTAVQRESNTSNSIRYIRRHYHKVPLQKSCQIFSNVPFDRDCGRHKFVQIFG